MYGTAEPESASYGEYATKLQESLSKAYTLARESLAKKNKKDKQNCTIGKYICMVRHMRLVHWYGY